MNNKNKQWAFSLVELLAAVTVTGVLIATATTVFSTLVQTQKLKAMASTLSIDLKIAKSEAIKRTSPIRITFNTTPTGNWCYGWKINAPCDCFVANSCEVNRVEMRKSHVDFPNIRLEPKLSAPGNRLVFENTRSFMASTYGHIRVKSAEKEIRIIVSRVGRIRTCSPAGTTHVAGYATAC
jgi:type IV fimbrial biogenesis protein FimT